MVNESLKQYIMENIFPLYQQNDLGHNLVHIKEVIRRCFVLNQSFKLNLDIISSIKKILIFFKSSIFIIGNKLNKKISF